MALTHKQAIKLSVLLSKPVFDKYKHINNITRDSDGTLKLFRKYPTYRDGTWDSEDDFKIYKGNHIFHKNMSAEFCMMDRDLISSV